MALPTPSLQTLKGLNFAKIANMLNQQSIKDLDSFLDKLPIRAGMNAIIVASVIWGVAGVSLLVAYTKSVNLRELQKEFSQVESTMPSVPIINYNNVSDAQVKAHIDRLKQVYKNLTIDGTSGAVKITATSTRDFGSWRSAINDLGYGGNGWRVQLKEFCAGRDCTGAPLQAILSVQQLDIKIPEKAPEKTETKS